MHQKAIKDDLSAMAEQIREEGQLSKEQLEAIVEAALENGLGGSYEAKVPIMAIGHEILKMNNRGMEWTLEDNPLIELTGLGNALPTGEYEFVEVIDHGGAALTCANGSNVKGARCGKEIRWECRVKHVQTGQEFGVGRICIKEVFGEHPIIEMALLVLSKIEGRVNKVIKMRKLREMIADLIDEIHAIDPTHIFTYTAEKYRKALRTGRGLTTITYKKAEEFKEHWTEEALEELKQKVEEKCQTSSSFRWTIDRAQQNPQSSTKSQPMPKSKRGVKAMQTGIIPKPAPAPIVPSAPPTAPAAPAPAALTMTSTKPQLTGSLDLIQKNSTFGTLIVRIESVDEVLETRRGEVVFCKIEDRSGKYATLGLWIKEIELDPKPDDIFKIENGWCKVYKGTKNITSGMRNGTVEKIWSAGEEEKDPDDPAPVEKKLMFNLEVATEAIKTAAQGNTPMVHFHSFDDPVKKKIVLLTILQLGDEEGHANVDSVIECLHNLGIEAEDSDDLITMLLDDGLLWEPSLGYLSPTPDPDKDKGYLSPTSQPEEEPDPEPEMSLEQRLKHFRTIEAKRRSVPFFIVLNDKVLKEIVTSTPSTKEDLATIPGITPRTIELYGEQIIGVINDKPEVEEITIEDLEPEVIEKHPELVPEVPEDPEPKPRRGTILIENVDLDLLFKHGLVLHGLSKSPWPSTEVKEALDNVVGLLNYTLDRVGEEE